MAKRFYDELLLEGGLSLPQETASRALQLDSNGKIVSSSVTDTELGYLSGVTSSVQTQINGKISSTEKGAANGVVPLNASSKIEATYLPSYVDDVLEYADFASLPVTGETGKIYVTLDDNKTYRWSGSVYIEISPSEVESINGEVGVVVLDSADIDHTQADIADWTVADGSSIAAHLDELADRMVAVEGGASDIKDLKVSANDSTPGYLEDKIVVAQGSNASNILQLDTLNDGANEDLRIQIDQTKIDHDQLLNFVANEHIDWTVSAASDIHADNISQASVTQHQAAIDHDALLNFVANEHVDHSSVQIATAADSGLSGGGDITATRNLSVDITGTTSESSLQNADELLIYDTSATALRKTALSNIRKDSAGDILETSFSGAESAVDASVTGFAFANGVVRSFTALVQVVVDATTDLYAQYTIEGIQKGAAWEVSVASTGDDVSVTFDISTSGQITYSSSTYAGFSSMTIKFRAITLGV